MILSRKLAGEITANQKAPKNNLTEADWRAYNRDKKSTACANTQK